MYVPMHFIKDLTTYQKETEFK